MILPPFDEAPLSSDRSLWRREVLECADIEGAGSGARVPVEVEHDPRTEEVGTRIDERRSCSGVKVACGQVDKVWVQLDPMLFSRVRRSPRADRRRAGRATYIGETRTASVKPIVVIHCHKAFPLRKATYDDATTSEIKEHVILEYYI